jgi:hypothetical protein
MWKTALRVTMFLLVASVSPAEGGPCGPACAVQRAACMGTARVDRLACKASCRDAGSPQARGECVRQCITTFRTAKRTCVQDAIACDMDCVPGDGCLVACGRELGQCGREVSRAAQACRVLCGRVPLDRGRCLGACAMAARLGMAGCRTASQACVAACQASPSGAFLDSSASPF